MTHIQVDNVSFRYRQDEPVLTDLAFEVKAGSFLGIAGPNGAGKSTLLNLLGGFLAPSAGLVRIDERDVRSYRTRELARKVAVVRQEFIPPFGFTVSETVTMARLPYLGAMAFESQADRLAANDAMEVTGTLRFADRSLGEISGGERQRVFIARALAQDTPILLLDEPTSFLDLKHQVGIFDLLKRMQLEKGKTIVSITHDLNLAAQYCDELLLLQGDGRGNKAAVDEILTQETIEKTFGVVGFSAMVSSKRFFLPLGKLAKDAKVRKPDDDRG